MADIKKIIIIAGPNSAGKTTFAREFLPTDDGATEGDQYSEAKFLQVKAIMQLLIVTPLQKIHIIEPFVASVGFVHNDEGRDSKLRNLSIEDYRAEKHRLDAAEGS